MSWDFALQGMGISSLVVSVIVIYAYFFKPKEEFPKWCVGFFWINLLSIIGLILACFGITSNGGRFLN